MELPDILTFLGLLIAAYGATQDYVRLKFKLASKWALYVLGIIFILLFLSTWEALDDALKQTCPIGCYLHGFWWDSRHFILVPLNLLALFWVYRSLKLRPDNITEFTSLVKELKAEDNLVMLSKLVGENVPILLELGLGQRKPAIAEKTRALFELTIDDKRFAEAVQKTNEHLGIDILHKLAEKECFNTEFANSFLIAAFKDQNSYIHTNLVEGRSVEITELLFKHQNYEQFDLGLNLCWAVLQLIEENTDLLVKSFEEHQEDRQFKTIYGLMSQLSVIEPQQAHLSNLPYYIQKELLEFIRLNAEDDETVAFELLVRFYSHVADFQTKAKGAELRFNYLNYLYSALPDNVEISKANAIRLGCAYINLIFNEFNREFIDKSLSQFKELFESYLYSAYKEKENLKYMFLLLLNKRRGRGDCEDWIHYTNSGNKKKNDVWNEMTEFLKQ